MRRRSKGRFLTEKGRWAVLIGAAIALIVIFGSAALDPGPQRLPPHYSIRGNG